jgi:hypothetical protein
VNRLAHDTIRLALPATDQYARVAGVATTGLCSRAGLAQQDADELASAVSDVVGKVAVEAHDGTHVLLTFTIEIDGLSVAIDGDGVHRELLARRAS